MRERKQGGLGSEVFPQPLEKLRRTLPAADLARYSISAISFGSTQYALWAIRSLYGWVRISGVRRRRSSAADVLSKPWSALPDSNAAMMNSGTNGNELRCGGAAR